MKKKKSYVVASLIKQKIKEAGMNTSQQAIERLSEVIEKMIQPAIESAKSNGRKTVMDRDIPTI